MARIFVTGSADGLGLLAARKIIEAGHEAVVHARNARRADDTRRAVPGAREVLIGDLSSLAQTRRLAERANGFGHFDAVIHNAAVGYQEPGRTLTEDGLPTVLAVNTIAPYVLTALMARPARLIYMSSSMHQGGDASLDDLVWEKRPWNGSQAYADSKLHDTVLAFAMARRWPDVFSNAVNPGWVPTRMGGRGAPDDLGQGAETQVWLATSDERAARVSGELFYHRRTQTPHAATRREDVQERLLAECARLSGIALA